MTNHKDARQLLADKAPEKFDIKEYISEYEFCGDGGDHVPTDFERALIEGAVYGCAHYMGEEHQAAIAALNQRIAELEAERQWQPIETAPEVKGDAFFCNVAWGPDDDKCTGRAFRTGGKWFAAAVFYRGKKDKIVEFKEIEVHPSHWMYSIDLPLPASPHEGTQS